MRFWSENVSANAITGLEITGAGCTEIFDRASKFLGLGAGLAPSEKVRFKSFTYRGTEILDRAQEFSYLGVQMAPNKIRTLL